MSNRAAKYEQLHKSLKKHYKPIPEPGERSVLEHLVYACCLEDARFEQADEAFAKLQQAYFDWNEVRVTTVIELGEALGSLPNPTQAGHRIKRCLQAMFEGRYQYDIEDMKKANLSKATDELTSWKGVTPFVLAYVSQNALGGHFIPVDTTTLETLVQADVITESEAEKKSLPGIERAITKTKGTEFSTLLHQFAVEFQHNPKNATALLVFKDLGVTPKAKPKAAPVAEKPKTTKAASNSAVASGKPTVSEASSSASKKLDKSKDAAPATSAKKEDSKKPAAKASGAKSEPVKPTVAKPAAEGEAKTTVGKKSEPAKAEPKAAAKKPANKEPAQPKGVKKSDSKPSAKKVDESSPAKPKSEAKKPAEPKKPTKSPPAAAKPADTKPGPSKGSPKEATNVKITKKKPR